MDFVIIRGRRTTASGLS